VRYFGLDREILIRRKVKVLGKSCFDGCKCLDRIDFEVGSELERISHAALRCCASLVSIEISSSVAILEESSFAGCTELESCLMDEDSSLVSIGVTAFAKCTSLRSFSVPFHVGEIGSRCFSECIHLYGLNFMSSESVRRIIGDESLGDALDEFGMNVSSSLLRIDADNGRVELRFPGWVSVPDGEGNVQLVRVRDLQYTRDPI
jgi:hypothetical protein